MTLLLAIGDLEATRRDGSALAREAVKSRLHRALALERDCPDP